MHGADAVGDQERDGAAKEGAGVGDGGKIEGEIRARLELEESVGGDVEERDAESDKDEEQC